MKTNSLRVSVINLHIYYGEISKRKKVRRNTLEIFVEKAVLKLQSANNKIRVEISKIVLPLLSFTLRNRKERIKVELRSVNNQQ